MKTIKQLLEYKGNEIITISPESSVYDAIKIMADHHIGSLMVMENDKLLVL